MSECKKCGRKNIPDGQELCDACKDSDGWRVKKWIEGGVVVVGAAVAVIGAFIGHKSDEA